MALRVYRAGKVWQQQPEVGEGSGKTLFRAELRTLKMHLQP